MLLKAMLARPASKGWFAQFGKKSHRRSRHIKSQMKFFSGAKGKSFFQNNFWTFANKQAKKYKGSGWTGIN